MNLFRSQGFYAQELYAGLTVGHAKFALGKINPVFGVATDDAPGIPDWEMTGWQTLPEHRVDITGELEKPLAFQWAGSLADLQDVFGKDGWRQSTAWTSTTVFTWLTTTTDAFAIPVMPVFAGGGLPAISLVRSSAAPDQSSTR